MSYTYNVLQRATCQTHKVHTVDLGQSTARWQLPAPLDSRGLCLKWEVLSGAPVGVAGGAPSLANYSCTSMGRGHGRDRDRKWDRDHRPLAWPPEDQGAHNAPQQPLSAALQQERQLRRQRHHHTIWCTMCHRHRSNRSTVLRGCPLVVVVLLLPRYYQ